MRQKRDKRNKNRRLREQTVAGSRYSTFLIPCKRWSGKIVQKQQRERKARIAQQKWYANVQKKREEGKLEQHHM